MSPRKLLYFGEHSRNMFITPEPLEIIYALALFLWILFVTHFVCRRLYDALMRRGFRHNVTVYLNRKIIHILTGGLAAVLVPVLFKSFAVIAVLVAVLAIGNYIPHHLGKIWYWYQVEENMYEVHFIIMWGLIMGLGFLMKNLTMAVLPILFMSVGDGVTGLVRNLIYQKRTKSWWGNFAMALFCVPIGFLSLGYTGAVAGTVASIVEKIEIGRIDDNITVPLVSFILIWTLPAAGFPATP
ncbi:MAG: dolichol kinase [Nitrososphaerota archaeon]|nr:dolichol kinase [Candidatus Calditenuaceae archaeon]MDW8072936.1 dolichol kinase [Nitrososphaerota archaeon]